MKRLLHFITRAEVRTRPPMWAWAISPEPKDVGPWCLHPLICLRDKEAALGGLLSHTTGWAAFRVETWVATLDTAVPAPAPAASCVKRQPDTAMFCAEWFFSSVRAERAGSGVDSWLRIQRPARKLCWHSPAQTGDDGGPSTFPSGNFNRQILSSGLWSYKQTST